MHTPPWLLGILISYLSNMDHVSYILGGTVYKEILPGGGAQGAHLGGIIFMLKYI